MTLKECYRILGVANTAKTDDVKRAYRRRAFELHPDLNPNLVDASRQFQLLNEAYVVLMRVLSEKEAKAESKGGEKKEQARQENAARGPGATADAAGAGSSHSAQAEAGYKDAGEATADTPGGHKAGAQSGTASDTQTSGSGHIQHEGHTAAASDADTAEARKRRMADSAYAQQEDVLRDILNDQFARRVFEDIYSEVNKKTARTEEKAIPPAPPKPRKLNLEWGDKIVNLDFTAGLGGMMRDWLRHQIDDTLTVQLPRAKLFPGARVRLQIRQGIKNELRVVEVILPQDFKAGKAIRLKGMGRKIGKWAGDLYLTIEAQQ